MTLKWRRKEEVARSWSGDGRFCAAAGLSAPAYLLTSRIWWVSCRPEQRCCGPLYTLQKGSRNSCVDGEMLGFHTAGCVPQIYARSHRFGDFAVNLVQTQVSARWLKWEFAGADLAGHLLTWGLVWGILLTTEKSDVTLSSPLFLTPKCSFALNAKGMALTGDKGVWIWDGQFAHSYLSQHEIQTCSSESHPAATFNHKPARRCLVTRRTRRSGNRCLPKLRIPSKCW